MPSSDRQEPAPAPGNPRPRGTIRIGSVFGSDVLVSSSWFLVAGLIAVLMAPRVDQVQPGLGGWKYVAGFAFAVVLYLSVLLHEAAHAAMARRFGYPVSSITLHFLGGMTAVDGEARRPRHEFLIAVVGPIASISVGAAAVGLWFVAPDGLLRMALEGLAGANLLIGALNLLPGLPLDGGRVLKAVVWRFSDNMHRGTIVAAWGGRIAALTALSWPLVVQYGLGSAPMILDYALAFIVAAFLWVGASAAMASARLRRRLPALRARELARRTVVLGEDVPIAEAVRRAQEAQAGSIVTTGADGRPAGIVNEAALVATPPERRPWLAISTVARALDPALRLPVGLVGEDLVRSISRAPAPEYLLLEDDGTIFGVLVTQDVDTAFRAVGH